MKFTPEGLDYTQIGTLPEPCITSLWFWEILEKSQSWPRTMQMDLWKLFTYSRIFEFATACPKLKNLAPAQKRDCVPFWWRMQTGSKIVHCRSMSFIFYWKCCLPTLNLSIANVLILVKRLNELFETIFFISLLLA